MTSPWSPREHCGLFGVYGLPHAAQAIYRGLFALQHRGQEGAGIAVSNGTTIRFYKELGLVSEVFSPKKLQELPGSAGIGHVRYSTTGSNRLENVQPIVVECVDGLWAVAHNGNLTNAALLRRQYQESGAIFQTGTDSEVLVHLLADPLFRLRPRRIARALNELAGAYAFLLLTPFSIMAARDPFGFRPLSIGRLGEAWIVASETCALAQIGADRIRDLEPGELITVNDRGLSSERFADPPVNGTTCCVFELVYFARPDSRIFGCNVHAVRVAYGARLAREHPVAADLVIPIPDSGNSAALGYSRESGIPLDCGFIRNHYIGRTFIMPQQEDRTEGVDLKLSVLADTVRGKRLVVVDDSIVRGTTARRRVSRLREAGAREVHVRVASPPCRFPCFYGVDFPTREELIAGANEVEDIRAFIGADSLGYLSLNGLFEPVGGGGFCAACFTGDYPAPTGGPMAKDQLEFRWEGAAS